MKTMAFLNIEDIAICSLLESNYPVVRDEYNIFKKEYLYNKSREELTEDDSVHWDLCRKGYVDSIKAAENLQHYQGFKWQEHTIEPRRKECNWYGLSMDEDSIWEGILLSCRTSSMYQLKSTILGSTYFPQTMQLLSSFYENTVVSTTIAVFPANKILPRHNGYDSLIKIHLPLYVPQGDIGFCAGEETMTWKTGKCSAFYDATEHNGWNNTNKDRVALIVDIIRK